MSPTLVRHQLPHSGSMRCDDPAVPARSRARTRDWAEIQERMLVPLYEAAYDRLGIGPGTRLLGLGCGSGLALLLAAARGAQVSGVDADESRLELARERLTPDGMPEHTRLVSGGLEDAAPADAPFNVVTAFHPVGCVSTVEGLTASLTAAAGLSERGSAVVLGGWGPVERCATVGVLRVAQGPAGWRPSRRDDLEELAELAGLRPDGSGRVACPFGYADLASAVRGLLSTGLFDAALEAAEQRQVEKELAEALHPHQRADGTVWMPNVFRYLIARTR
ncbi:methyltransferase domain-containing protein [Streptomyces decoyicus]|uniref:methyltransferase domain-containing protein n=1 Tax=Streptomyces decoyicus TaxID=249567 RepID=UPI0004AA681B|nr:class I SAM-dependent methyltransferase [Streptomyces decoyicus]KOG43195.1 methyltransferase type 11 [Streptomyces decoyicus]QZY18363.1 class I SAM-dependent methyltransferase [Streptomyces decoyicus]